MLLKFFTIIGNSIIFFKTISIYWFALLLGFVAILIDFRLFLFYAFVIILVNEHTKIDYLRKLIRIFQIFNEVKMISIIRKLGISEEEIKKVYDEEEKKWNEKQREEINKDLLDIMPLDNFFK